MAFLVLTSTVKSMGAQVKFLHQGPAVSRYSPACMVHFDQQCDSCQTAGCKWDGMDVSEWHPCWFSYKLTGNLFTNPLLNENIGFLCKRAYTVTKSKTDQKWCFLLFYLIFCIDCIKNKYIFSRLHHQKKVFFGLKIDRYYFKC